MNFVRVTRTTIFKESSVPTKPHYTHHYFRCVALKVVEEDGDLALSSYARVGRALSLYQVGDRSQSILELEDMSVDLKGYPGTPTNILMLSYQYHFNVDTK